ncbi:hypothetical protein EVAR_95179_1 [Eumeta japonica]|uniref:Uncharacterized protein n=1 Tax=Eumeta variegata TaxID=151549 RepID=A0A4C1VHB7_EUMVA|nr:hypothetical protein EVAR_95179_1 [Eumeta japonica]
MNKVPMRRYGCRLECFGYCTPDEDRTSRIWRSKSGLTCSPETASAIHVYLCVRRHLSATSDNFDVKDVSCSGRPDMDKADAILEKVEQDQHISSCDIAEELRIDHKTVLTHTLTNARLDCKRGCDRVAGYATCYVTVSAHRLRSKTVTTAMALSEFDEPFVFSRWPPPHDHVLLARVNFGRTVPAHGRVVIWVRCGRGVRGRGRSGRRLRRSIAGAAARGAGRGAPRAYPLSSGRRTLPPPYRLRGSPAGAAAAAIVPSGCLLRPFPVSSRQPRGPRTAGAWPSVAYNIVLAVQEHAAVDR